MQSAAHAVPSSVLPPPYLYEHMFPLPKTSFRTLFRRSLDAAIDFATLGEYGLASAWEDPAATGSGTAARARQDGDVLALRVGVPAIAARGTATASALLKPVSAAGRARRNDERRDGGSCAGAHSRTRALERQLPRTARSRDGMAPREQGCLFDANV